MTARCSAEWTPICRSAVTNGNDFAVCRNDLGHRFRFSVASVNMHGQMFAGIKIN